VGVALAAELVELVVDAAKIGHALVGLDLQGETGGPIEATGHADDDVALVEVTEIVVPGRKHGTLERVRIDRTP
jgi:hypothetical protein